MTINFKILAFALAFTSQTLLAAPDETLLGKDQGYPIGERSIALANESTRVGMSTHFDTLWPHGTLKKSAIPTPLKRTATPPNLQYQYKGKTFSVENYLEHQRIMGLLIIKDGEILVERYQYGRQSEDKFLSNSMVKSITSLGIGFALQDGAITSLDDKAATYVPELRGYAYGETSIRDLLRMSSGVKFSQEYDGKDDNARFSRLVSTKGTIAALQAFEDREAKPGTHFHYASSESAALGAVLNRATGKSLTDYLEEKLWQPMGAEADATWIEDPQGLERASGHFNAILRDYGRLGVLLANDGNLNGKQILPKSYLLEATDWHQHPPAFAPKKATPFYGYGYQFWLFPGEKRRFAMLGIYGQVIFVDPEKKLVLVQTAAAKNAMIGKESMAAELNALWNGVLSQYQ